VEEPPENLTTRRQAKLAWIAKTDPTLHRAYLLKEGLRLVFQLEYPEAVEALEAWIGWDRRCRIPTFVDLQRRIVKHKVSISPPLSTACPMAASSRSTPKIRLITRVAFGFKSSDALIALAMLNIGGHRPVLPGRK
jgi:transposase